MDASLPDWLQKIANDAPLLYSSYRLRHDYVEIVYYWSASTPQPGDALGVLYCPQNAYDFIRNLPCNIRRMLDAIQELQAMLHDCQQDNEQYAAGYARGYEEGRRKFADMFDRAGLASLLPVPTEVFGSVFSVRDGAVTFPDISTREEAFRLARELSRTSTYWVEILQDGVVLDTMAPEGLSQPTE